MNTESVAETVVGGSSFMSSIAPWLGGFGVLLALIVFFVFLAILYRRVVPTNMVHTVQSVKKTTSYGTGIDNGNVYYAWPSWIPILGVKVVELPVSNFDLSLNGYEAYDKDRVPFRVDVTAFFRINDTNVAAQRVASLEELQDQLEQIVQGAVRKILANDVIDSIMLERSKFGDSFTEEVEKELSEWGIAPVKNMELMDIRDSDESNVIQNIMAKKKSEIEMESRTVVAKNMQIAEVAEIEARQIADIRDQEAKQAVGQRTAEKDKQIGVADEQAAQEIKEQKAVTAEKDMAIMKINEVREAEISKEKEIVAAEQDKQTTVIIADGQLEAKKKEAEGIRAEGEARADAEKAMQLAPVKAQIELAKEIGANPAYMKYLISIEAVAAQLKIGTEQAKALVEADLKVIANSGDVISGASSLMDMFTTKGGTAIGGMLEAVAQSDSGKALMAKLGIVQPLDITSDREVDSVDTSTTEAEESSTAKVDEENASLNFGGKTKTV